MGIQERKEREREQRRNDILASARKVFLKYGIEQGSMDRIAQEAELSKGTLYLYYRNRDELIGAMVVEDLAKLIDMLEEVLQRKVPAKEKMLDAVMAFHRFSKGNEFFYKVVSQINIKALFDCGDDSSNLVRELTANNERMMSIIATIIQEGADNGEFHLLFDVDHTVRLLLFALKGSMVLYENKMMSPSLRIDSQESLLHDIATLFIHGLEMPKVNVSKH